MTWFNNDEGFEAIAPKKNYTRRFWMPNDTDRLITFVDTPLINLGGVQIATPFLYNEYRIQLNGNWNNWFTKPLNQEDDVLGSMGYRASKVAALTVVDHYQWEDKRGNTHKDEVVLYVIKRSTPLWKQIQKIIDRGDVLHGKTYRVHRMGDKSSGTGVMLEKHHEDFQLNPDIHEPFDYLDILKPKSKGELEALFASGEDAFKDHSSATSQAGWGGTQGQQSQGFNQNQANSGWGSSSPNPQDNRVYGTTSTDPVPF